MAVRVGVLALQGGVIEHLKHLDALDGVESVAVKKPSQLDQLDALILPGGESTTMGKLVHEYGFVEPIQNMAKAGRQLWGTCAGLILLAGQLALVDITVQRNGYGRQLDSFVTSQMVPAVAETPLQLVFIRAPIITGYGASVTPLATVDGHVVAARADNILVTAFHPELTPDTRFHQYFVNQIEQARA